MAIVKWEPFRDLMAMQDRMTRLFDETLSRIWKQEMVQGEWSPAVDIFEKEDELVFKIDLPEMAREDIDVRVEEDTLTIQGERKFIRETSEENYIQIERPYGSFRRTFSIRKLIDPEKIRATYDNGVLRVTLPKRREGYPRRVVIEEQG